MEGWKRGRMDVWKDGRMEGWKDGRGERWRDGRGMDVWKDGSVEGWKCGRMEEGKDGRMEDGRVEEGRMEGWTGCLCLNRGLRGLRGKEVLAIIFPVARVVLWFCLNRRLRQGWEQAIEGSKSRNPGIKESTV